MTKFLFAAALVALFASAGAAEEKAVVASAPVTTAAPVMMTSVPMMEMMPAQTQRRGLFGRLRNRNSTPTTAAMPTMMSAPVMTTPAMSAPTAMPMPMPGAAVAAPMAMPTAPSGVVVASGTTTITDGAVMPAAYTEPTQTTTRRGLFGRLRNR